ncbi:MAG: hypothetical protein H7839_02230 [Magnetococcus sp. YQC-5]
MSVYSAPLVDSDYRLTINHFILLKSLEIYQILFKNKKDKDKDSQYNDWKWNTSWIFEKLFYLALIEFRAKGICAGFDLEVNELVPGHLDKWLVSRTWRNTVAQCLNHGWLDKPNPEKDQINYTLTNIGEKLLEAESDRFRMGCGIIKEKTEEKKSGASQDYKVSYNAKDLKDKFDSYFSKRLEKNYPLENLSAEIRDAISNLDSTSQEFSHFKINNKLKTSQGRIYSPDILHLILMLASEEYQRVLNDKGKNTWEWNNTHTFLALVFVSLNDLRSYGIDLGVFAVFGDPSNKNQHLFHSPTLFRASEQSVLHGWMRRPDIALPNFTLTSVGKQLITDLVPKTDLAINPMVTEAVLPLPNASDVYTLCLADDIIIQTFRNRFERALDTMPYAGMLVDWLQKVALDAARAKRPIGNYDIHEIYYRKARALES